MPFSKTDIDELILLEQEINLLNGPIVLLQLLRLLLPAAEPFDLVFGNTGMGLKAKFPHCQCKIVCISPHTLKLGEMIGSPFLVFCLSIEAFIWITTSHRAIGGLGIAGIRSDMSWGVLLIS